MIKPIAFIPARSGSRRVKDKNIKLLGGKPLIWHTINVAKKSGLFSNIYCITDSNKYLNIAKNFGVNNFPLRPISTSSSKSPDFKWVSWAISRLEFEQIPLNHYFILRPTSPFRTVSFLKRAYKIFKSSKCHSIRAIEKTPTHPGKIWIKKGKFIVPLIKKKINKIPWHSSQYAALPKYFSQNASLEISSKDVIKKYKSISGNKICCVFAKNYEGFDINTELDFELAKIIYKKIN